MKLAIILGILFAFYVGSKSRVLPNRQALLPWRPDEQLVALAGHKAKTLQGPTQNPNTEEVKTTETSNANAANNSKARKDSGRSIWVRILDGICVWILPLSCHAFNEDHFDIDTRVMQDIDELNLITAILI